MKSIFRALGYIKNYKGWVALNIFLNIIASFLEVVSLMAVIPLLQILFSPQNGEPLDLTGDAVGNGEVTSELPGKVSFLTDLKTNAEHWFNNLIANNDRQDILIWICLTVFAIFLLKNLIVYTIHIIDAKIKFSVSRDLRNNLYNKIINLPVKQLGEKNKGDLLTRFSSDIIELENGVLSATDLIFKQPAMLLFYILSMVFISPKLTLFVFILIPVLGLVIGRISKSLKRSSTKGQDQLSTLISMLDETIFGSKIVKAFTAEESQLGRFKKENQKHYRTQRKIATRRDAASPVSEFLGILIVLIVMWYGGKLILTESGGLGASAFIGFIILFARMNTPLKALTKLYANLQKGLASADRLEEIQNIENPIQDKPDAKPIQGFTNGIQLQNVSFAYTDDREVLSKINMNVPKGHTVALVGQSGAGKTTIADLLPRFYDVHGGAILIDGENIKNFKLKELRGLMGIVTQDAILFNDTVFNNIAFGLPEASMEAVIEAAKVANAHVFIDKMEDGYHTVIGERGSKLSGGQRQRLTIARAVLKNPPILILDEATSALDTESEKLVQDALEKLMKDRTSIVIAHRLSTIQNADHIYVMQDGKVIEEGNHQSLLQSSGSYSNLVKLQSI